jgi:tetratricopeptide (TPR) repeat protein
MDIGVQIKTLLSEAEIYRTQGLFSDAREKYQAAASTIQQIEKLKNKQSLLKTISRKIKSLEDSTKKISIGPESPELSEKGQDLIKDLFGKNELEKAVALIKFGQIERAVEELTPLLDVEEYRYPAGKHILQCKILAESSDDAIDQYKKWFAMDLFSADQLETLREYLQNALQKEGVRADLPGSFGNDGEAIGSHNDQAEDPFLLESEEEILDITSIGINFSKGPQKGNMVEFDVNFQSGDMLSLIISKTDEALIEDFDNGEKLHDVQFYSPIAMFNGTAVVVNKTKIETGPKQGDYCLDLKVKST